MGNREKSFLLAAVILGVPLLGGAWALGVPLWGFEAVPFYVAPLVLASFANWRWGLWIAFSYITIEGIVYLSLNRPEALLFKDAILGAAYVGFFLRQRPGRAIIPPQAVTWPLFLLVGMYVVQVFNSGVPSLAAGLVGLRVLAYYIPIYYLAQHFVTSFDGLRRFLYWQLALSIPVSLFGLVQNRMGEQWWASLGAGFYTWGAQGVYRVTSTFSFVNTFGAYTHLMIILAVAFLPLARKASERWFLLAALAANILGLLLNSQRGSMAGLLVEVALVFLFVRRQILGDWLKVLLLGGGLVGLVLWLFPNLWYRTSTMFNLSDNFEYTVVRWEMAFQALLWDPASLLVGYGTGTALTSLWTVGYFPLIWENWMAQLLYMFGAVGMVFYYAVFGYLTIRAGRAITSFHTPAERWFATIVGVYLIWQAIPLLGGESLNRQPDNMYFWFLLGGLEVLSRAAKERVAAASAQVGALAPGHTGRKGRPSWATPPRAGVAG